MSLPLVPTPAGWASQAVQNLPALMADHAHCEKKAAAHALALLSQYPERPKLVLTMAALAREELSHFRQVVRLMQARGFALTRDSQDGYVKALLRHCRHGVEQRLLDRLLVAGLVEARSAERLGLIAEALPVGALRRFYERLATCEAGHFRLFLRLASTLCGREATSSRWAELVVEEEGAMLAQPFDSRVH